MRAHFEHWLARQWQRRGLLAYALSPAAWIFGLIAALRRALFRCGWQASVKVGIPVIVVGNVTVGGSGKTPTVIALIDALRAAGFTPGVVSRGYGGNTRREHAELVTAATAPELSGDEPRLIAQRTGAPVVVCPDRVAAAKTLRASYPDVDVLISDDGLQHYRLARDVEIVVFDHRLGGNGFLLPAGPLRESMSRYRDATLINLGGPSGGSQAHADRAITPLPYPEAHGLLSTMYLEAAPAWNVEQPNERRALASFVPAPDATQASLAQPSTLAAAGIGAPERFFTMLRAAGLRIRTRALADHQRFAINPFADDPAEVILVTEKDAVKCDGWHDARIWAVPVRGVLDPRLIALVVEKVRGCTSA